MSSEFTPRVLAIFQEASDAGRDIVFGRHESPGLGFYAVIFNWPEGGVEWDDPRMPVWQTSGHGFTLEAAVEAALALSKGEDTPETAACDFQPEAVQHEIEALERELVMLTDEDALFAPGFTLERELARVNARLAVLNSVK